MKTSGKAIFLSILALVLVSCSGMVAEPTQTPVPTATSLPTETSTLEPTIIPTKTSPPPTATATEFVLPLPIGTPAASWEGIRIMPGALAGQGDSQGYSFIILASVDQIGQFYKNELTSQGWTLLASGKGSTNESVILIFMKESSTFSVSIIPQSDGTVYVLLVK